MRLATLRDARELLDIEFNFRTVTPLPDLTLDSPQLHPPSVTSENSIGGLKAGVTSPCTRLRRYVRFLNGKSNHLTEALHPLLLYLIPVTVLEHMAQFLSPTTERASQTLMSQPGPSVLLLLLAFPNRHHQPRRRLHTPFLTEGVAPG